MPSRYRQKTLPEASMRELHNAGTAATKRRQRMSMARNALMVVARLDAEFESPDLDILLEIVSIRR